MSKMHFFICIILFFVVTTMCFSESMSNDKTMKYVIVDTDMVADDAWALQMIINAEKKLENIKVLAITLVNGNTDMENAIKNTYRILDGLNRTDIPIYKGATEAIIPIQTKRDETYRANGMCDIDIWKPNYPKDIESVIQPKNAVDIIRELVMKYPHQVSLLGMAPLTNIALAVKTYPEIANYTKQVILLGGNYQARGNAVPGVDINTYLDPESTFIVLNSTKCPVTMVPYEIVDSLHIPLHWRFNILGSVNEENVQLLNVVEKIALKNSEYFMPLDAVIPAVFLFPETCIIKIEPIHALIELQGLYTRGEMILDNHNTNYNADLIKEIHTEVFKNIMLLLATSDG